MALNLTLSFIGGRCYRVFYSQSRISILGCIRHQSTMPSDISTVSKLIDTTRKPHPKVERISKAMVAYLEKAKKYDAMMLEEISQYEIGRRHLANIMGADPESFSQEDIDKAIEYLLPSGLFAKAARPLMKHPYEIFPKKKMAQFARDGRPYHFLFYTVKPNYYGLMHNIAWKVEELKKEEDKHYQVDGVFRKPPVLNLKGSTWFNKEMLKTKVLENISDIEYQRFLKLIEHLVAQPFSYKEKEFIMQYRQEFESQLKQFNFPEIEIDENGRQFCKTTGKRKKAEVDLILWIKGSGKVEINGQDLSYFQSVKERNQILFPLQFMQKTKEVDIKAEVSGGGISGQAGAVRLALSRALATFMDQATVEKMRLAGLLTRDIRRRERKKPGQPKARKKNTWKKR